jgi:hypothetical protein
LSQNLKKSEMLNKTLFNYFALFDFVVLYGVFLLYYFVL